jgi:hypothetical protein
VDTGQQTSPEHPPPHTTGVRVQIPHLWGGRVHRGPARQRQGVSLLWVVKSVGRPPRLEQPHQPRGTTRVTGGQNLKVNQKTTKSRSSTTRHTNSTRSTMRAFRGWNRRSQGTFQTASGELPQQKGQRSTRFVASQQQEPQEHDVPAIDNVAGNKCCEEPRADKVGSNATQADGEQANPAPAVNGSANQYWGDEDNFSDVSESRY